MLDRVKIGKEERKGRKERRAEGREVGRKEAKLEDGRDGDGEGRKEEGGTYWEKHRSIVKSIFL